MTDHQGLNCLQQYRPKTRANRRSRQSAGRVRASEFPVESYRGPSLSMNTFVCLFLSPNGMARKNATTDSPAIGPNSACTHGPVFESQLP